MWDKKPFFASYWAGQPTQDLMYSLAFQSAAGWNETNGTVNLTNSGYVSLLFSSLRRYNLSDLAPSLHGQRIHFAEVGGRYFMAWKVEQAGYGIVDRQEPLQMSG